MHPKISVIVPVFNQEKYIGRCLRSILSQTIPDNEYEVIVVDDGSTDRTPYALDLFHNAIVTIRNATNEGLPVSLNKGISLAKGKYIVRLDSDDFVNTNFLNFLLFYIQSKLSCFAVACDYLLVDNDENVLDHCDCEQKPIGCGILFDKEYLMNIGLYDEDFLYNEEVELRRRFEKETKIERLPLPLYRYRRHEKNMTNNKKEMRRYDNKIREKHGF